MDDNYVKERIYPLSGDTVHSTDCFLNIQSLLACCIKIQHAELIKLFQRPQLFMRRMVAPPFMPISALCNKARNGLVDPIIMEITTEV